MNSQTASVCPNAADGLDLRRAKLHRGVVGQEAEHRVGRRNLQATQVRQAALVIGAPIVEHAAAARASPWGSGVRAS